MSLTQPLVTTITQVGAIGVGNLLRVRLKPAVIKILCKIYISTRPDLRSGPVRDPVIFRMIQYDPVFR